MRRPAATIVEDVLYGFAIACAAAAAALALRPVRADVAPLAPSTRLAVPAAAAPAAADPAAAQTVVATDPFSPTRTPPTARYQPPRVDESTFATAPGLAPDPSIALMDERLPAPPAPAPDPDARTEATVRAGGGDATPRFYGTVTGADGTQALLRLDARQSGARLYAEGARDGRWRVVHIETDRVELVSDRGRHVTLRLPSARVPIPESSTP